MIRVIAADLRSAGCTEDRNVCFPEALFKAFYHFRISLLLKGTPSITVQLIKINVISAFGYLFF